MPSLRTTISCASEKESKNCNDRDDDKNDWLKKLYRFTKKTKVYRIAINDSVRALVMDMTDNLTKLINEETKKVPNSSPNSDKSTMTHIQQPELKRIFQ